MLSAFGAVSAFEPSGLALGFAAKRGIGTVIEGSLPDRVPFQASSYDLVVALDVLEHLDDDLSGLQSLFGMLKPGGYAVFTVPALPWLWSKHDEINHHRRRYTSHSLNRVIGSAGFRPLRITYYNSLLFPLVAVIRAGKWLLRADSAPDEKMPSEPLNAALRTIFASESWLLRRIAFPIGVSLLAVVRRAS